MTHRRSLIVLGALLLAACATPPPVSRVASGETVVRERLVVDVADTWNAFAVGPFARTPTWTQEGIFVDALKFYVGIHDGEPLVPAEDAKAPASRLFKATMRPDEIVELFKAAWSVGGSTVTIDRVAPQPFLGGDGLRIDYSVVRRVDEVRMRGVVWVAVRGGQLFAIDYVAPRLAFFDRYRPRVEAIAASARLRG